MEEADTTHHGGEADVRLMLGVPKKNSMAIMRAANTLEMEKSQVMITSV